MNDASVSTSTYAEHLVSLHLPRYDEIPSIDLYMDQLVGFLEDTLAPLYQPGEKIITRSMVNNYVKQAGIGRRQEVHALPHRIPHRHLHP